MELAEGLVTVAARRHRGEALLRASGLHRLRRQHPDPRAALVLLQLQVRRLPGVRRHWARAWCSTPQASSGIPASPSVRLQFPIENPRVAGYLRESLLTVARNFKCDPPHALRQASGAGATGAASRHRRADYPPFRRFRLHRRIPRDRRRGSRPCCRDEENPKLQEEVSSALLRFRLPGLRRFEAAAGEPRRPSLNGMTISELRASPARTRAQGLPGAGVDGPRGGDRRPDHGRDLRAAAIPAQRRAWATCRWTAPPPRCPAARGSGSGWPRRSAPGCAASSTCSTNPPSGCTRATTGACSTRWRSCGTWATRSSSWNTTRRRSAAPTTSSISGPGAGRAGGEVVVAGNRR